MGKKLRPNYQLWRISKIYPEIFSVLEIFRSAKGSADLGDWPNWCYLPVAASYSALCGPDGEITGPGLSTVATVSSLAAWRTGQSIYRFDQNLYKSLIETPVSKVPVDALYRLPEWGLYIETPEILMMQECVYGFFCHLEHDMNNGRPELRLLLDVESGMLSFPLHMTADTVDGMLESMIDESLKYKEQWDSSITTEAAENTREVVDLLSRLISLVLYLCSDEPDMLLPSRPNIKKTKKGLVYKPKPQPKVREVGFNVGQKIRAASASGISRGTGINTVVAHIRKAHWHSYWTGPRDGERNLTIKWLSPVLVNVDDESLETVTIKKVKK